VGSLRPFRFGIQQHRATSAEDWREKAKRAEALGYDILVVPDHIGQGVLSYAPALTAVADATTALGIGTLVLDNDFRHPALLAADATTLDVLSDGRFELGIGAGWDSADYEVSGIPFDPANIRVSRFEESVQIIKALFTNDSITFAGEYYSICDLKNYPSPVQQPHPPILIGAGGPRMLSIAAREADIVSIMPPGIGSGTTPDLSASSMTRAVGRVRHSAGDRFDQLELSTLLQRLEVTDKARQAAEDLASQWDMTTDDAQETPWALIGTIDQIADKLRERRERFGLSYWILHDRFIDIFAPVVAELAGE
jgi:probable F420-dependent oxidoreductase